MLRIVIWVFVFNFVNPFVSHLLFARGEQAMSLRVGRGDRRSSRWPCPSLLIPRWGAIGAAYTAPREQRRGLLSLLRRGIQARSVAAC